MRPGGELLIVTDHEAYAAQVRGTLAAQDWFESRHATAEVAEIPDRRPTKYEAKARAQGASIHYFEWIRVRAPDILPASPRPDPDRTMLSLTLRGAHDAARSLSAFEPRLFHEVKDGVEVVVRLVAAYRRVGGGDGNPLWMVETLVKEDELLQECAIAIVAERDRLLVKLSSLGRALPTYGVKRAVWLVSEMLRQSDPGLELVHENLGAEIVS